MFIADQVHNLTYRWGDHPTIGGLLKETVKSKVVTTFRWISVILGLAMIGVGVGFKIRKRIKEGRSS
jgi:hypothetical protein